MKDSQRSSAKEQFGNSLYPLKNFGSLRLRTKDTIIDLKDLRLIDDEI